MTSRLQVAAIGAMIALALLLWAAAIVQRNLP